MWNPSEIGLATWTVGRRSITIDARGGPHGIQIASDGPPALALCPVDDHKLPSAGEQFVRGKQWNVNFPQYDSSQGDSSYALRLSFDAIESTDQRMIIEVCVSIQTDLLDLHPKLDAEIDCDDIDSIVPSDPYGNDQVTGVGTAPISVAKGKGGSTSVLLGPHDHPFTTNHSTDMLLRLRLFGDFLEKGVIRKARPWIVFDYDKRGDDISLENSWRQLCESPLPLTP